VVVVEMELFEAAFLIALVRAIGTLGFTVTNLRVLDTVTIGTSPFSFRVTTTDLGVVLFEASEAAEIFTFVRLIRTLGLTITVVGQLDAVSIVTLPLIFLAAASLVVIE
jgi:hypothetical protein